MVNRIWRSSPAEDLAFSVARFVQKGGSFINYYMYHGGTNFGRTAGGPFITTSYDYDAPLDEYGLLRQPKWGHLRNLHRAIKLCEPALVSTDPTEISLGNFQDAQVFNAKSGASSTFLSNYNSRSYAKVAFNNVPYDLPPWSIRILPNCRHSFQHCKAGASKCFNENDFVVYDEGSKWFSYNEESSASTS